MDLSALIQQLRTYAPILGGRVAGGADFAALQSDTKLILPAAYVLPGGETATENDSPNGLTQQVTETFSVIVVFDNSTVIADRRGQTAVTQVSAMGVALRKALLNLQASPDSPRGISYVGSEEGDMDQARLFWRFEFGNTYTITEADGFQPPYPDLVDITIGLDASDPTDGIADVTVTVPDLNAPTK